MKKFKRFFLWLMVAAALPAQQLSAECSYPTKGTAYKRSLSSFEISDGTNSAAISVGQSSGGGASIYFDKTGATPLETYAGSTLSFSNIAWSGSWMHAYLFIDYDGDGDYDSTLNATGKTGGELVSYTYYKGTNSLGETTTNDSGVSADAMPAFVLPDNLASGSYKALFKIDWDDNTPCGSSQIGTSEGAAVEFTIKIKAQAERTVTIRSNDPTKGTVAFNGYTGNTVTLTGPVTVVATPAKGYSFVNWTTESNGEVFSSLNPLVINNSSDISLIGNFGELTYPTMTRTFTNNATQQNRYLKRVTTQGTATEEVFNCTTTADLPYTSFTASANTYVAQGANIDKTANPIVVESGTTSFQMTYYGWEDAISGYSSQMNWVQEAYYVDWNGDGVFSGTNEISAKGWTTMPNANIFTGATRTVTIPEGQAPGTYRMRVVFYEPASSTTMWQNTLFTTLKNQIRNGISYDMAIQIVAPSDMKFNEATASVNTGKTNAGTKNVALATVKIGTSGTLNPLSITSISAKYTGDSAADISNLRWVYSTTTAIGSTVAGTSAKASESMTFDMNGNLRAGDNYYVLLADVAEDAATENIINLTINDIKIDNKSIEFSYTESEGITIVYEPDYTLGNALWFDTPNSSTAGVNIWNTNNFGSTDTNPDQIWERKSFPIGNGSFGGNILGSVNRERVVLNEKTLWKGGPGTGASAYWDMNKTVSSTTLQQIRTYLENGNTYSANSLVVANYAGKIDYNSTRFGSFTTMGEAYVSTGISESGISDYKRIMNIDKSLVVVQFNSGDASYRRKYFTSYPDNVMVWNYTSDGADQNLTFSFSCPQTITAVEAADGGLIYKCKIANNSMAWAMRVYVRVNGKGTVTTNATARTITVSGATDVDFILAADTDYKMNFNPSTTDNNAFVGEDPVANVNKWIDAAKAYSYDELYNRHYEDYANLYNRTEIAINPDKVFSNLPTPTRLANYRNGTLDHALEQMYFQYGRYLLISSSREGNMPANLQGMWHNNTEGPWRVDYHNNINLQMNYWPATATNLLECFTPFIDYVRGLVEPGKRTAQAYYGARGWTAEVSTNIFGFTAPLNSNDMSWNYNPTAGPWLAAQLWEYYDYSRDNEWLKNVGYEIIKGSANFCSDLLYKSNGTYTSAPSYSPEHGTADLGATYANAVTREVLMAAIKAAQILDVDADLVAEWKDKLDNMYPYKVGRYGQLQEWYNDIDTYNDTHRHTNHLFGLHPGSSINALTDTELVNACKETLRQRGDAATGWSMGWKLNHWARLLDGDHAYILFQNLIKDGTADNLWDLHPPFQIDGNFGGTAGIAELFLQSQNGMLHLLPALPSSWTNGHISGLLARGNFVVDIHYAENELDHAVIHSNVGGECKVHYNGKDLAFDTTAGNDYTVRYNKASDALTVEGTVGVEDNFIENNDSAKMTVAANGKGNFNIVITGNGEGSVSINAYSVTGQLVKSVRVNKTGHTLELPYSLDATAGCYILRAEGAGLNLSEKVIVR